MSAAKHVVITGVSRGLGASMCREFIRRGHIVSGCARHPSEDEVAEAPHEISAVDVCDRSAVLSWATQVIARQGPPDLLLNNAALINRNAPLWEVPAAEFEAVVDVNIKGVFHVLQAFLPAMMERGSGVVVNFSSGWGRSTSPDVAPYCATKWAIEGLTRALADELPAGLAALPLNPGVIHTDMLDSCFGAGAAAYPGPDAWAERAVPFLLELNAADNGKPLTAP
mgnify:CR=1 FL=1